MQSPKPSHTILDENDFRYKADYIADYIATQREFLFESEPYSGFESEPDDYDNLVPGYNMEKVSELQMCV